MGHDSGGRIVACRGFTDKELAKQFAYNTAPMRLQILGLNHNTAPVEIREQVVFAGEEIGKALERLTDMDGVDEAVLLSTCNRTEFYVLTDDAGRSRLQHWLQEDRSLDPAFVDTVFTMNDDEAIRHIFRVACGLDSLVLGEPQILGQLKDAVWTAEECGTLGKHLQRLFQHTFSVAKKVRTDTEIGANPVSVASAAVSLAQQFFSGFQQHTAVLVGAGVTVELLAKHLSGKGIGRLFVANRNLDRARNLASQFGGYAVPLSELGGTLQEADILITSTASPEPVVSYEQLKAATKARKRKPIFAVDIAVPRDIDPKAAELSDVYLYTVDDLDKVILEGQGNREAAAVDANRILDAEISRYLSIERAKQVSPVITALREQAEVVRDEVLGQARRRLAKGVDTDEVLEFATAALMKKLLHSPSVRLREAAESEEEAIVAAARRLFDIDDS